MVRIRRNSLSAEAKRRFRKKKGNSELKEGNHLMKTITNCEARPRKRRLLLSLLCAGIVATFLGGCAEGPYVTAYDSGYYYPTSYYTPDYDYYGPTYSRTIVRSGVRYSDSYGPRYYSSDGY
jgi:hypothetical protein